MVNEFLSERFLEVLRFTLKDYKNIGCLLKQLSLSSKDTNYSKVKTLSQIISFEQLEMLEAELHNQQLINLNNGLSLYKIALHDASLWRWKAQRLNADVNALTFNIQLANYIAYHASKLAIIKHTTKETSSFRELWTLNSIDFISANLKYLDQLAVYVLRGFDCPENRYYQGLNLVLDVLTKEQGNLINTKNYLTLPLNQKEFAKKIACIKQSYSHLRHNNLTRQVNVTYIST